MTQKTAYRANKTTADILHEPFNNPTTINRLESQVLLGVFVVVGAADGAFFKGRSRLDGYKGYVHRDSLTLNEGRATHFCSAGLSLIRRDPDIKSREVMPVSFMSRLEIDKHSLKNGFMRVRGGLGWIPANHIEPLASLKERVDYVSIALRMQGMPYRYGGRSTLGLDCSALVQITMTASGWPRIPRDTDMQEKSERLGHEINPANLGVGDIVFFPQHVGIMVSQTKIISATEKSANVMIENIHEMAARQNGITTVRRPNTVPA